MQIYSCILLVCFIDLVTSAFTKDDVTISCTSQCIKDNVIEGGINDNRTLIFTVKSASFLSISIKFKGIHLMKGSATLAQGPKVAANDSHPYRSRFKIPSKAEFIAAQKAFIFKFTLLKLALQDTGSSFSYTVRYITGEQLPTSGEILISVKDPSTLPSTSPDSNVYVIIGIVIAVVILLIVVVLYLLCKAGKITTSTICPSDCCDDSPRKVVTEPPKRVEYEESQYAQPAIKGNPEKDPLSGDAIVYSELGPGGGRLGPKPVLPYSSNYAKVKNEDEYHERGPSSEDDGGIVV